MPAETSAPRSGHTRRRGEGLLTHLVNVYRLVVKELRSIRADPMMLILVAYAFSVSVYTVATGASTEAKDLTVGVVDEDHSNLSRRLLDALNPPLFKRSVPITANEIDANMNDGRLVFVLEIPPPPAVGAFGSIMLDRRMGCSAGSCRSWQPPPKPMHLEPVGLVGLIRGRNRRCRVGLSRGQPEAHLKKPWKIKARVGLVGLVGLFYPYAYAHTRVR
jgi:hypothetical protein